MASKAGQGATEYLIILAALLAVALISVAILNFFPEFSSDARADQSKSYWKSAYPLGIISGYSRYSAGPANWPTTDTYMVIRNNGATTIQLMAINVNYNDSKCILKDIFASGSGCNSDSMLAFFSGELFHGSSTTDIVYINQGNLGWKAVCAVSPTSFCYDSAPYFDGRVLIEPGETVGVGFKMRQAVAPELGQGCVQGSGPDNMRLNKQFEIRNFIIYYREIVDGKPSFLKKEIGAVPLILPCRTYNVNI